MKRRVTIADVAREAGVVPSTVSYVLNNSRNVSPEIKAAVFAAVEKLKYRPSSIAQGLRRGKKMAIGVLTKDPTSPFHYEIVKALDDFLHGSAYHSITANSMLREPEQDEEVLDLLIQRGVDGIVLVDVPIAQPKLIELAAQIPLVIVNRLVKGLEQQCIVVENYQGGYDATNHLITLGHTRIAHLISDITFPGSQQRLAGYCQALTDAGLSIDESLIVPMNYQSWGIDGKQHLFAAKKEFTAIFAGNDLMAYDVLAELYRLNIRVPDYISIIGHDDYPLSFFATPALTTMHVPLKEIGVAAAESILRLSESEPTSFQEFSSTLVVRASTGPVPSTTWLHRT